MSQQTGASNVERAYRAYAAFNRRDWEEFRALMHEEVESVSRLASLEGAYHGHEGLRRWWDDFLGIFPDYTIELDEVRDLGEATLARFRGWGHSIGSEMPLIDPVWQLCRWREGRCIWWRNFPTEAEALEAARKE